MALQPLLIDGPQTYDTHGLRDTTRRLKFATARPLPLVALVFVGEFTLHIRTTRVEWYSLSGQTIRVSQVPEEFVRYDSKKKSTLKFD